MSLPCRRAARFAILAGLLVGALAARERWTELTIGPFTLNTQGDVAEARDVLTQAEQLRWVMGALLEKQDLRPVWPIRLIFLAKTRVQGVSGPDVSAPDGELVIVCAPGSPAPLAPLARLLLDANTPRLPDDAEEGLIQLLSTIKAKGSHVTWGGPVSNPGLPFARMQLFATRFEYSASFHVLVVSLKSGSSLRVAERNAFGKDPAVLEQEARAALAAANWQEVSISGRPLDPKRDFGEHSVSEVVVGAVLAGTMLKTDPAKAESLYKAAIEAGGAAKPLGFAGLAALAQEKREDPKPFLQSALSAGSMAPAVYVASVQGQPAAVALPVLKRAAQMNPAWAVPLYEQSRLAAEPAEKEALLQKAAQMDPRATRYWLELAQLQASDGHAIEAQGSWLRAEDSAPPAQREEIRKMRDGSEQARLDAAEVERTRERDTARLDDQRAQDSETARIRAAEAKANRSLDTAAGEDQNAVTAVPWDATLPQKRFTGTILEVECLRGGTRLTVRDRAGKSLTLVADAAGKLGLSCGPQQPPPRVTLAYAVDPDPKSRTAGRVVELQLP